MDTTAPCVGFVWFRLFRRSRWHCKHTSSVKSALRGCKNGELHEFTKRECCKCGQAKYRRYISSPLG